MANELLKTIDFGDGIKRAVAPEWENIQNKPENLATKEFVSEALVNADWNQNDETAKDYIKNRPFYKEEYLYTFIDDESIELNNELSYIWMQGSSAVFQEIFYVTFNGSEYEFPIESAVYDGDVYYFGNMSLILDEYENTGELFCIECSYDGIRCKVEIADTYSLRIIGSRSTIYKIDEVYVPDTIARIDDLSTKLDVRNPNGTGSFSLNRKANSDIGSRSFAVGNSSIASGMASYAAGVYTEATGTASHAEGDHTIASGNNSHAEGMSTQATGINSHAEGMYTMASSDSSHAEGAYTIASSKCQHVQGKYNVEDAKNTYAHIVGNGTGTGARSNAHTLDWDGNAWFSGDVYIGSTSGTNKDEGSKKLATEEFVTEAVVNADWNQNDETAKDYIKNRPFYSNGLNLVTLVDNVTIEEMEIDDNGISWVENPFELVLIEGNNYIVTWNGVDYNVTCSLLEDTLFIGNASIFGLGEDTGEPFLIGVYDNVVDYIVNINSITSAPITISIQGNIEDIQKIDSKYLPPIIGKTGSVKASEIFNDYVNNVASGVYSHAEGTCTTASGWHSHAEGAGTIASGECSHAEGCRAIASGSTSHAEGESTASGSESHAEGLFTTASGWCSHSEGRSTLASGEHSHAEGEETIAASEHQHVQGKYNIEDVNNKYAHIVGNGNYNKRSNAHTLDWDGNAWFKGTIKIGGTDQDNASAVEVVTTTHLSEKMDKTNPTGTGSFSLNRKPNTTIGFNSFAEGNYTVASGKCSHAEGYYARAEGSDTHAEGYHAKAIGEISHAEGEYTIAASEHQHVQGKYNIEDNSNIYAHIVGNGTTESKRSNAHTLDWDGNAWFSGDIYVGSTSGINKDEGSKKLATEEFVTENYYTKAEVEALIAQAITAAIAASY